MLPSFSEPHGRRTRSALCLVAAVAAAVIVISGTTATPGSPPVSVPASLAGISPLPTAPVAVTVTPAPPGLSDVRLARAAMAALDGEPQLRGVTLLVSVIDRVAVLGGPVPTAEHGRLAETLVRRVDGIAEVRNRCFVLARPDPLLRAVADRLPAPQKPLVPELPGVLPGSRPVPIVDTPLPTSDAALAATDSAGRVTSLRPPVDLGILLPPSGPAGRTGVSLPAPVAPIPASTIPPPTVPVPTSAPGVLTAAPPRDLLTAAEAARQGDTRFAGLRIELRHGLLVISGTADRAADAWHLAQIVRRLPGQFRVVIGEVTVR